MNLLMDGWGIIISSGGEAHMHVLTSAQNAKFGIES